MLAVSRRRGTRRKAEGRRQARRTPGQRRSQHAGWLSDGSKQGWTLYTTAAELSCCRQGVTASSVKTVNGRHPLAD